MRGGYALARVVVSEEEIGTPYPDYLDILCCMDENSYQKYGEQVRPGGTIVSIPPCLMRVRESIRTV